MAKFEIEITETLQRRIVVEAETDEEAYNLVYDAYRNGEIVLDSFNLIDWQVDDLGETDEEITEF